MCKHIEIVVASRNAVVGLRASLWNFTTTVNPSFNKALQKELSRREVAYDVLLNDLEKKCLSCKYDEEAPNRESDFLRFVDEFVSHYNGGKCPECED